MKYTKADVTFVAVFLSPILLVACLFGLASISWATQQSRMNEQAQQLISETTDEASTTLESIFVSEQISREEQQIRISDQTKWDEILLAFQFILQRIGSQITTEEDDLTYQILPPSPPSEFKEELSQSLQSAAPLLKQLDKALASGDTSLADAMKDRVHYAGVAQGNLENVPTYLVYRVCYLNLWHSIAAGDEEKALLSIERLLYLMTGQPSGLHSIFFSHSTLTHLRESLAFEFWKPSQLQRIHDQLAESTDFSKVLQKHELTKALLVKSALPDARKLQQLQWLTPYVSLTRGSNAAGRRTIAPSQALRILDLISPDTAPGNPAGYERSFGLDRWLNRSGMQAIELTSHWIPQPNHYRATAQRIEKDRIFTRAAVGMRMIHLQTGSYPGSLDPLTTLGWSEVEIAEATKLLEWENAPDAGESTLTAIYADWMKDADGEIVDGGFSKQVRFIDGS